MYSIYIEAANRRYQRDVELKITNAWWSAALTNAAMAGEIPDLQELLGQMNLSQIDEEKEGDMLIAALCNFSDQLKN
jgi:hypothetical protein